MCSNKLKHAVINEGILLHWLHHPWSL